MPTVSVIFTHLEDRLQILEDKFLKDQILDEQLNPLTFQPDLERIAAFRLLVHAEIEDYIERKAKEWIGAKESILSSGTYSANSMFDLFPIVQLLKKEITFEIPFDQQKYTTQVGSVLKTARELINDNNGIKSDSFLKLSLLCGKTIDEIDNTIAVQLTDYGKTRGDVAHTSTTRVPNIQAPSVELKRAKEIVTALKTYFY